MRILMILMLIGFENMAHAATFVYVSMAPEQRIQIYQLDDKSGALQPVDSLAVDGAPGCMTVDSQRRFLFASLRTTSSLASFQIDPKTGKLTLISTAGLPAGANAAYVTPDRTDRWLLSASYMAGTVVVHPLGEDGKIQSPSVQTVTTARTAHCVAIDRDQKWVFVPHVAPNAIFQFHLDSVTGKLTEAGRVPGGTEKAGPRHLAIHPSQLFAYSSDESGSSVTAYRLDAETGLTSFQTLSTLPADYAESNSTAEVKIHPSGKFVWVSNRGHDSLAGFSIDSKSGWLSPLGQTPTEKTPRSFEIDPSGDYAFGAGEGSGKLAVFRIDQVTGHMARIQTYDVGKSLTWVLVVKTAAN
ncbi:MAG: lactonase family protein [Planctomycetes bacterium]|nr:lactonase family protein [Planctomycetota bacterium]